MLWKQDQDDRERALEGFAQAQGSGVRSDFTTIAAIEFDNVVDEVLGEGQAVKKTDFSKAMEKAKLADRILRERLDRLGLKFERVLTEFVGANATHGSLAGDQSNAPEVQLRFGVRGPDRKGVERFTREIAPLVLNGPPSVTGFAGGRPRVEEIVAYWPALIDKSVVKTSVDIVQ